ncbi:MAG: hypothetical protein LBG89_03975 [Rickettsiales bacterium]|jgi:hypothetical protein|nr:hypothetical protein [Rickettsiales bacterium]
MRKILLILTAAFLPALALADYGNFMAGYTQIMPFEATKADFVHSNNYEYMRPYMNPQMAAQLSPGNTAQARSAAAAAPRRMVPRSGAASAARSATAAPANTKQAGASRRVVPRQQNNTAVNKARAAQAKANTAMTSARSGAVVGSAGIAPSGQVNSSRVIPASNLVETGSDTSLTQCMSEYKKCMDSYCHRPNTKWDRCYCSPRMAQLDGQFQPKIEKAERLLVALSISGKNADYADLAAGIEFDWASAETRIQGQEAFTTAARVCNERLRPCFSVAGQLVNLYRSEMNKDCQRYEANLNIHLQLLEQEIAKFQ